MSPPLMKRKSAPPAPARPPAWSARIPGARGALDVQRDFAAQPGGAVLDGRDIGTVIARMPM
jgi:hypothetical protein